MPVLHSEVPHALSVPHMAYIERRRLCQYQTPAYADSKNSPLQSLWVSIRPPPRKTIPHLSTGNRVGR
eukprot:84337-Rhodomonas_salina.1